MKTKEFVKEIAKQKKVSVAYWSALIFSVIIMVVGFLVPPTGAIDGSVLVAVGMVLFFTCIYMFVASGMNARLSYDVDDKKVEIETNKD